MVRAQITIEGQRETQRRLRRLGTKATTRAMRKGVTAGAAPHVKALRARVPVEEGILKKSIGKKIKQYRSGSVVMAMIGARNRRVATRRRKSGAANPANYLHLVDQGARPHSIAGTLAFRVGDRLIVSRGVQHPGVTGRRVVAAAARASTSAASRQFNAKFKSEVDAEARKGS